MHRRERARTECHGDIGDRGRHIFHWAGDGRHVRDVAPGRKDTIEGVSVFGSVPTHVQLRQTYQGSGSVRRAFGTARKRVNEVPARRAALAVEEAPEEEDMDGEEEAAAGAAAVAAAAAAAGVAAGISAAADAGAAAGAPAGAAAGAAAGVGVAAVENRLDSRRRVVAHTA